jgi:hypothetical protein
MSLPSTMGSTTLTRVAFLLTAAIASYCIIGLHIVNGTFAILDRLGTEKIPKLPGSSKDLKLQYTMLGPLDAHLATLVLFFWNIVSGDLPALSFFSFYMSGQVLVVAVLVLVEGHRAGSAGKVISLSVFAVLSRHAVNPADSSLSSSTIWGLLYQTIPWGVVMPIYFAVHMWTSPIAPSTATLSHKTLANKIFVDSSHLRMLPVAVTVGYIIPTALIALPSPKYTTFTQHQNLLSFWQAFPLWIGGCQLLLKMIVPVLLPSSARPDSSANSSMKSLRKVYIFALSITGFVHITTIALLMFPPRSFWSPVAIESLRPSIVFLPMSPFSGAQAPSLAHGCLYLLQYDMYFACSVSLFWGLLHYHNIKPQNSSFSLLLKALGFTVAFGPGGAALAVIWERDEQVFREARLLEEGGKRRNKLA